MTVMLYCYGSFIVSSKSKLTILWISSSFKNQETVRIPPNISQQLAIEDKFIQNEKKYKSINED